MTEGVISGGMVNETKPVNFRANVELLSRLNGYATVVGTRTFGGPMSRTSALHALLHDALTRAESEYTPEERALAQAAGEQTDS